MKKIILLLTICLTASCVYKNMYNFEDGDLDWMSPYNDGDTVMFETNNGLDMLIIDESTLENTNNPFVPNEGALWEDYHAFEEYEGRFIHNSTTREVWMRVFKCSNGGLDMHIQLGLRFCFGIEDARNLNKQGSSIKDTVIIDDSNSEYGANGPLDDDFEYFKWSKKEGLIEYRLRDGTVYPKP
jgi:hypothetical protein